MHPNLDVNKVTFPNRRSDLTQALSVVVRQRLVSTYKILTVLQYAMQIYVYTRGGGVIQDGYLKYLRKEHFLFPVNM